MKGTIKSIEHNGKWTNIVLSNGEYTDKKLTGNSEFDARFKDLKEGQEIDFSVKDDKWINLTKEKKAFGGAPKDWTFEKKRAALDAAVHHGHDKKLKTAEVLQVADAFFEWLNKK